MQDALLKRMSMSLSLLPKTSHDLFLVIVTVIRGIRSASVRIIPNVSNHLCVRPSVTTTIRFRQQLTMRRTTYYVLRLPSIRFHQRDITQCFATYTVLRTSPKARHPTPNTPKSEKPKSLPRLSIQQPISYAITVMDLPLPLLWANKGTVNHANCEYQVLHQ